MDDDTGEAARELRAVEGRLATANALLAEWTASAAQESPGLTERLEQMGYEVRGKSHAAVVEVLKRPPTRAPHTI